MHSYTSPLLVRFNERIVIAGEEISDAECFHFAKNNASSAHHPCNIFRSTTAAAFLAFSEHPADILLLETGLGGRLDATNVIANPAITILTPIDYDHMEFLGNELTKITAEKSRHHQTENALHRRKTAARSTLRIEQNAMELDATLYAYGKQWNYEARPESGIIHITDKHGKWTIPVPNLLGIHQFHNAALAAIAARECKALEISLESHRGGHHQSHLASTLTKG